MSHIIEQLNKRKLRTLSAASFVLSISTALLTYIESRYLETVIGPEWLGLGFFVAYGMTLIALDHLPRFVAAVGKQQSALLLIALTIASLVGLAFVPMSPWFAIPIFTTYIVGLSLVWIILDFFIEMYSTDALTGTVRGRLLTITNAGWVIVPFAAFWLFDRYGYSFMFLLAAAIAVPVFLVFRFGFTDVRDHLKHPDRFFKTFARVLAHPSLVHIFIIAFMLQFFYGWMIVYTPLHLRDLGILDKDIGKIFSVMLLPFVLLQYPAGVLADKKWGEKEMLVVGLFVMGAATFSMYWVQTTSLIVWAGLLFATRIGAALLEIMRDTYFFKQIDYRDLQLMSFFRNTGPLAYMLAPLFATGILFFAEKQVLFLILGVLLLCTIYSAAQLKDTK